MRGCFEQESAEAADLPRLSWSFSDAAPEGSELQWLYNDRYPAAFETSGLHSIEFVDRFPVLSGNFGAAVSSNVIYQLSGLYAAADLSWTAIQSKATVVADLLLACNAFNRAVVRNNVFPKRRLVSLAQAIAVPNPTRG